MKRPLCMLCLIYVGFVLLFYALFPPGNPEREGEGQRIRVTGSIVGLEEKNQKSRIYLKENPGRAGLICYLDDPSIIYSFKIGQTISVAGTRRFFEKATNEGQFDANLYYSILECDYFMTGCEITLVEGSYNHFAQFVFVLHHKLSGIIAQGLPSQEAGILQAMLLGEKGNLDPDIRNLFSRNGIAHILAISGLHITFLGMGFFKLCKKVHFPPFLCGSLSFGFVVFYGTMTGMGASAFRSVVMFSLFLLAGICRRTYDMLSATALSAILLLIKQPLYVFHSGFILSFFAIMGIALLLPVVEEVLKPFCSDKLFIRLQKSGILASLSINLFTFPILLYFFFAFPTYSILLNLLIVPLLSVVMLLGVGATILGLLLGEILPSLGAGVYMWLFLPVRIVLLFYEKVCILFDGIPGNSLVLGKPATWTIVVYYLVLVALLVSRQFKVKLKNRFDKWKNRFDKWENRIGKWKKKIDKWKNRFGKWKRKFKKTKQFCFISPKASAFMFLIPMLFAMLFVSVHPRFRETITMLDIGQGDSFVLQLSDGTNLCVDGGSSSVTEAGKYRLVPYLKSQGISHIDYAFISHSDSDHTSGIMEILENPSLGIVIENVVLTKFAKTDSSYGEFFEAAEEGAAKGKTRIALMQEGDILELGRCSLQCIYPGEQETAEGNDQSMVLLLRRGNFSMLFTGDLTSEKEEKIIEALKNERERGLRIGRGNELRAEKERGIGGEGDRRLSDEGNSRLSVLKVGHHGSKYSSSESFLNSIQPQIALISCGERNQYGHPHEELLERLDETGAKIYRTDEMGAVSIKTDGKRVWIKRYK